MRLALYGLPCAGKTTLMNSLSTIRVVHGSDELSRISGRPFSSLNEQEKNITRVMYTEYISSLSDKIVLSDGHYSFGNSIVFTSADASVYDVFLYLYCDPHVLSERFINSNKNQAYSSLSIPQIEEWQQFEINQLRRECHQNNKDFFVIPAKAVSSVELEKFIHQLAQGYSCVSHARQIVSEIRELYPTPCHINVVDGDKTIIKEDSFRICSAHKTNCFDGDFYTGYQALNFASETNGIQYNYDYIPMLHINHLVYDRIRNCPFVILSAGITELWLAVGKYFNLSPIIADPKISADTKFFVVKFLQESGYTVSAFGDSKNDVFMLKQANAGFLYIGERISRSLDKADTAGLMFLYLNKQTILDQEFPNMLSQDISVCKSNSGIAGSELAAAHLRLGEFMGKQIKQQLPSNNAAIIVLDRGGRFFGDGLYASFGGVFYPFNPAKDPVPTIKQDVVVIVDSVINTGESLLRLIDRLKLQNPQLQIVIASNVIQQKALAKFAEYRLFAIRVSGNSYIGKNQAIQAGNSGPDTADRLYNLIPKFF